MIWEFIYIIACINTSFLLLLNKIPLYGYAIICLFIHQFRDIDIVFIFWLLWKDPDAGKDWRQEEKEEQQRMRWLDSITDSMDMNSSKLREKVKDREAWRAAAHRAAKSRTWLSNIINNAAMNMRVKVFLWTYVFYSFG